MVDSIYQVLLLSGQPPRIDYDGSILARPVVSLTRVESVLEALLHVARGRFDLAVIEPRTRHGLARGFVEQLRRNPTLRAPRLLRVGSAGELAEAWPGNPPTFLETRELGEFDRTVSSLLGLGMRRSDRFLVRARVGSRGELLGRSITLSASGLLLATARPLALGEVMPLELLGLDTQGFIAVTARVLRRESDPPGSVPYHYSMEFLDLPAILRERIESACRKASAASAAV